MPIPQFDHRILRKSHWNKKFGWKLDDEHAKLVARQLQIVQNGEQQMFNFTYCQSQNSLHTNLKRPFSTCKTPNNNQWVMSLLSCSKIMSIRRESKTRNCFASWKETNLFVFDWTIDDSITASGIGDITGDRMGGKSSRSFGRTTNNVLYRNGSLAKHETIKNKTIDTQGKNQTFTCLCLAVWDIRLSFSLTRPV